MLLVAMHLGLFASLDSLVAFLDSLNSSPLVASWRRGDTTLCRRDAARVGPADRLAQGAAPWPKQL